MDKQAIISNLKDILERGVMSPMLKEAVSSAIKALENNDLELAYQITACKSLIVGDIDPKITRNAFQEDGEANEKTFGSCLYSILDGIHFELAVLSEELPSGITLLSKTGRVEMVHEGEHPVIKRILQEHENIKREVEELRRKRG